MALSLLVYSQRQPFTRNARYCWACGGARAFTALSEQVDDSHRTAYTSRGGDEASFFQITLVDIECSWPDEVTISSRNSEVIHAGAKKPRISPPLPLSSLSSLQFLNCRQVSTTLPI